MSRSTAIEVSGGRGNAGLIGGEQRWYAERTGVRGSGPDRAGSVIRCRPAKSSAVRKGNSRPPAARPPCRAAGGSSCCRVMRFRASRLPKSGQFLPRARALDSRCWAAENMLGFLPAAIRRSHRRIYRVSFAYPQWHRARGRCRRVGNERSFEPVVSVRACWLREPRREDRGT